MHLNQLKMWRVMCGFGYIFLWMMLAPNVYAEFTETRTSLIKNGGFEFDLSGWQLGSTVGGGALDSSIGHRITSDTEHAGAIYMNAQPIVPADYIQEITASQCVPIGNAQLFEIEAQFRYDSLPDEVGGHRINLIWYEDDACTKEGQFGNYIEPKIMEGWQTVSQQGINPALNAHSVMIVINQNHQLSIQKFGVIQRVYRWVLNLLNVKRAWPLSSGYWDNVALYSSGVTASDAINQVVSDSMPSDGNYVRNGSFDLSDQYSMVSKMGKHDGWTDKEGNNKLGAIRTSLHSDSGSMGTGVMYQCVNFGSERSLAAGVSAKFDAKSTQTGKLRFRVTWAEHEDCKGRRKIDDHWADAVPTEEWQQLVITGLQPPANARSVNLEAIQAINGKGDFSVFWDDLYLEARSNLLPDQNIFGE